MASYTLKDVDDKLWKEVKILAIKKGITIQELIVRLLEVAVKKGVEEFWKEVKDKI